MQKVESKLVLEFLFFEIAGLRHFLPRRHFSCFFLVDFLWGLCSFLGASCVALGFLEGLFGGLWSQKHENHRVFYGFFKAVV